MRNVAIVPSSLDVQLCSTGFTVLRSNGVIDSHFLFRYVLTDDFIDRVTPQQTGTHYPATSDRVVMGESLPLPPLAEQQRIVTKVEELLARVNAACERLEKAAALLGFGLVSKNRSSLIQAILAKAFRGELVPTEAELARQEGRDYEPASVLLERIRAERVDALAPTKRHARRRKL